MAVTLLVADAQRHIAQKIAQKDELIKRASNAIRSTSRFMLGADFMNTYEGLKRDRLEYQNMLGNHQAWSVCMERPVEVNFTTVNSGSAIFGRDVRGSVFLYFNCFYEVTGPFNTEEARSILQRHVAKERRGLDAAIDEDLSVTTRSIPENVRHEVWRRDLGRCVTCGSQERLEFDHVIPFSQGGSNTARNVQLLCEACNREKSDRI